MNIFNYINDIYSQLCEGWYVFIVYLLFGFSINAFVKSRLLYKLFYINALVLYFLVLDPLSIYLGALDVSSTRELNMPNVSEAIFYLDGLLTVGLFSYSKKKIAAIFLSFVIGCFLSRFVRKNQFFNLGPKFAILIVSTTIIATCFFNIYYMFYQDYPDSLNDHFACSGLINQLDFNNDIDVYVIIGESNSAMHMGVYDYIRNTTPGLSSLNENGSLILFKNVFSSSTLTSQSLKEQFIANGQSFPVQLMKKGVNSFYISNQGSSGTWNSASRDLFGELKSTYKTKSYLGSYDFLNKGNKFDHEFFSETLDTVLQSYKFGPNIYYLHMYAGHGPYLNYIPPDFRKQVDLLYAKHSSEALLGTRGYPVQIVEDYDSAIRYVDFNVERIIKRVQGYKKPSIVVYTSDHGESPFTNSSHDPNRNIYEMNEVPFIIYANSSAHHIYKRRINRLKILSTELYPKVNILASVIAYILTGNERIYNCIRSQHTNRINNRYDRTGHVWTVIDPRLEKSKQGLQDTYFNSLVSKLENKSTVCFHRSNTIATAIRGSRVADCLEIDTIVNDSSSVEVYQQPYKSVGLELSELLALKKIKIFWLDARNLTDYKHCESFRSYINDVGIDYKKLFLEISRSDSIEESMFSECRKGIVKAGARVSYYVPTDELAECTNDPAACDELYSKIDAVLKSGGFTDISFDFTYANAIRPYLSKRKLSTNSWHVSFEDFVSSKFKKGDMIILKNNDKNTR